MKRITFLLFPALVLCGCSNNRAAGGSVGTIDCYSIKVTQGSATVFSGEYSFGYSHVYEYKDASGNKIYASSHYRYNVENEKHYAPIHMYEDEYTESFTSYALSRFVGYIKYEENYYFNLSSNTIDSEIKWSECDGSINPDPLNEFGNQNNEEAYKCAKESFYEITLSSYTTPYFKIIKSETQSSIERHLYTKLGDDCVVTYVAKW